MKDRLLLLLTGIVCAGLAWLAWSRFPDLTIGLIVLGPVVCSWVERRRRRLREKLRAADGDRRERQRQLRCLAGMLAALQGRVAPWRKHDKERRTFNPLVAALNPARPIKNYQGRPRISVRGLFLFLVAL